MGDERGEEGEGKRGPEFYRFAWMSGNSAGRYGNVGVWDENGEWIPHVEVGQEIARDMSLDGASLSSSLDL